MTGRGQSVRVWNRTKRRQNQSKISERVLSALVPASLRSSKTTARTATGAAKSGWEFSGGTGKKKVTGQCSARIGTRAVAPCTTDRKSTRLNSSHSQISYAVFCLKKKTTIHRRGHAH